MDNASKALIMAGAILISVAIIGVGIYIFSAASNVATNSVNEIDIKSAEIYNNGFYTYAGHGEIVDGSRAQALKNHAQSCGINITTAIDKTKKYQVSYTTGTDKRITNITFTVK